MNSLARWLVGFDARGESTGWRLDFQSLPQGPWAFAAAAGLLFALFGIGWLYRREGRELSRTVRWTLGGLRLLVLVGVVAMLFELIAVQSWTETLPSHFIVLVDSSQSMDVRDPYAADDSATEMARQIGIENVASKAAAEELRKRTRLDLAKAAVEKSMPAFADGREVHVYGFGGKLGPPIKEGLLGALKATESTTAIGDAVRDALAAHRGQPLAGVLVVSDGRSNAGLDPHAISDLAMKANVPVAALALGTPQGPRNARLAGIRTPPAAFVGDVVEVPVVVESRGMKGTQATVTLEAGMDGGVMKEIGSQVVSLEEDGVSQIVKFKFTPDATGRLLLGAKVQDAGPELTEADNRFDRDMRIVRDRTRVLLISGNPSPEVQFLKNALQRDRKIEFSGWFQNASEGYEQPGDRPLQRLPSTQQELDRYDVLLMIDPDMQVLGLPWVEMLENFVGRAGGGLIYVAGESNTPGLFSPQSEGLAIDNSWLKMMPVVRDPGLYQSSAEVQLSAQETWTLELTPQGIEDRIFAFSDDPNKNKEILSSLPGMFWHFPVTRAKAGATVLARHGDPRMKNNFGRHVLLATHLYGPGRTVFVGFDSTYRWRYLDEQHYDGFWARLVKRVGGGKVLGGGFPFTLTTDKSSYRMGERVTLTARFLSAADGARELTGLPGEVEVDGRPGLPLTLEPVPHDPESFQATFLANDAGAYRVKVQTSASVDSGVRPATANFRVEPPRQELDNPTWNFALLDSIARSTSSRAYTLRELDQIPQAFGVHSVSHPREETQELWDKPIFYIGILLLITAEWILRKRYRMA